MKGDRHKPLATFMRWIETTADGMYPNKRGTRRTKGKVDNHPFSGKTGNKWIRKQGKKELKKYLD